MKHVIIGCGIAGITAAETLRRHDAASEIIMIADEPYYYRAALSFLLRGKIDDEEIYGKPPGWHEASHMSIRNDTVTAIDTQKKRIALNAGDGISYDRLLIASGARPQVAPWPGADLDGVCTYRSLDCVKRFQRHVENGAQAAVVIGGGILGVELVDDFVDLGLDVTLLVRGTHLLDLLFDTAGASIIENQMKCDGVHIRFQAEVQNYEGHNGKLTGVVLTSGHTIVTDLVGIAIGIRANMEFLESSDIRIDRAVLVNQKLQTSVEDVYAAGDVCAIHDPASNRSRPTRTWLSCALQGETAALNMLGQDVAYDEGVFFNASHAYRSKYAVLGTFRPETSDGYEFVICTHDEKNYEKLVVKNNRIVGAMFIGAMKNVWPVKQMIEAGRNISPVRDQLCGCTDLQMLLPNEHAILY
jgi:NAD(P)H-nitrite reductase large subunit